MLITQYILNIDKNSFSYVGAGTIFVYGSAIYSQTFNGVYSQQFYVGEYVYDSNHTMWQIVSITGDAANPTYNATANGEIKSFFGNELIKLEKESQFFNNQYDSQITSYQQTIQKIDSITPPPDTYNTGNITPRFAVGEYVIDSNNAIWIILSIENNVTNILYTIYNITGAKIVLEIDIYKLNEESQIMGSVYDQQIQEYQSLLNQINERIVNF